MYKECSYFTYEGKSLWGRLINWIKNIDPYYRHKMFFEKTLPEKLKRR